MNYKGHSNCTIMFIYSSMMEEFKNELDRLEKRLDEDSYIVEDIKFSTSDSSNNAAIFIVRKEN